MFYRTQMQRLTFALAAAMVEALAARPAAALLTTPTVRLYTNAGLNLDPLPPLATFTEATFAGYAAATIASWIGPVLLPPNIALLHAEADFLASGGIGAGQVVTGFFLTDSAGPPTLLYYAENFVQPGTTVPAPFSFLNPGDFLSIDVAISEPQNVPLNL